MPLTPAAQSLYEAANHPLAAHSRKVAELVAEVGAEVGLPPAERQDIEMAALLHDIGKLGLMDDIVDNPNGLTDAELDLVKQHPERGQAMIERAGDHFMRVGRIVRSCHERWDGHGYPDRLAGEQIPIGARIVFCCDAYDAMISERPYSPALTRTRAVTELWACAGTQFDPNVVSALVRTLPRVAESPPARGRREAARPAGVERARPAGSAG